MASQSTMEVNGKTHVIEKASMGFSRPLAPLDRKPTGPFQSDLIHVTVRVTDDVSILENAINDPHKTIDTITLKYFKDTDTSELFTVKMNKVFVVDIRQSFDQHTDSPMLITYAFTAHEVSVNNGKWSSPSGEWF